jgi:hypothetical protein
MAKIFIPACKEYREIDQIVSFGCSMTMGSELLDQERFPELPDVEAKKKELGLQGWYPWQHRNRKISHEEDRVICNRERQLAWPAQFAKLYDIPCYNYAEGASSFEKQISQFMQAREDGRITYRTLVLWGFTAKERGPWFQLDRWSGWMLNGTMEPDDGFTSKEVAKFWVERANSDMMLLWKYYMCLYTAFSLAKEYCNDQFLFVQALKVNIDYDSMPPWEREQVGRPEFVTQMKEWCNIINPKYEKYRIFNDPESHIFFNWTGKFGDGRLGAGHPTLESHQRYAQTIVNELDNKAKRLYNTSIV